MAVFCNVFKPLSKNTGNFYLFSQYTEDMTRFAANRDSYIVTPSKFIAMDVDYKSKFDNPNSKPLFYLQNHYENGCSYIKNNLTDSDPDLLTQWDPNISFQMLMRTLSNHFLTLTQDSSASNQYYFPEVKYIGNIDIQSYNDIDGEGFGEIYCYIPNDEKSYTYKFTKGTGSDKYVDQKTYIEGWSTTSHPSGIVSGRLTPPTDYIYSDFIADGFFDNKIVKTDIKYSVNTILVLYDVYEKDSQGNLSKSYENLPMGIYFAGTYDEDLKNLSNSITKYCPGSNAETFGDGTSYGLRICTRFVCLPNGDLSVSSVNVGSEQYSGFSQAMTMMAESQSKMNTLITEMYSHINDIKLQLAEFKNYRTNVPYVKTINGKRYWFVNGRQVTSVDAQ